MGKRLAFVVFGLALIASACSGGVKGAQTYKIQGDQPEPTGKKIQFSQFFPGSLTAKPGDTIIFSNASTEAPHTFTFGIKADRSDSPSPEGPHGLNPAVFAPCFDAAGASKTLTSCKLHQLPDYDGTGYWNSGAIFPGPTAKPVTLKLSDTIKPGQYTFVCVLHTAMNAILTIGDDRKSPADVAKAAASAEQSATKDALAVMVPASEPNVVTAGWGTPAVSYNQFAPLLITVPHGTTVTWEDRHPQEPHTVTFASPFHAPTDRGVTTPGGVKSGGDYSGGFSNSGFIAGPRKFSLKFVKAGTYTYVCAIHPGMGGTIKVT